LRHRAAELEGHGLLKGIKAQQALAVAMANGLGRHHLRIEQRVPGQVAVKDTAMPVSPIHHGRTAKSVRGKLCFRGHTKLSSSARARFL
jgi:hypothetical protein